MTEIIRKDITIPKKRITNTYSQNILRILNKLHFKNNYEKRNYQNYFEKLFDIHFKSQNTQTNVTKKDVLGIRS